MRYKYKLRNINFFYNWIKKPFLVEKMVLRTRRQGPPHMNKVKQYEIMLTFKLTVFTQFIQS